MDLSYEPLRRRNRRPDTDYTRQRNIPDRGFGRRPGLMHRFNAPGRSIDRDLHETTILLQRHDDIDESIVKPAEIGPHNVGIGHLLARRHDGGCRRHHALGRNRLPHGARSQAILECDRGTLGVRLSRCPQEGHAQERQAPKGYDPLCQTHHATMAVAH